MARTGLPTFRMAATRERVRAHIAGGTPSDLVERWLKTTVAKDHGPISCVFHETTNILPRAPRGDTVDQSHPSTRFAIDGSTEEGVAAVSDLRRGRRGHWRSAQARRAPRRSAQSARPAGNEATASSCADLQKTEKVRTREQTDNMTPFTKGPVPKQGLDTFTWSESQESNPADRVASVFSRSLSC